MRGKGPDVTPLITKGKEEASSSCLITEEEMEEIPLSSISSPCLTIQY